jgi:hypothetical protein
MNPKKYLKRIRGWLPKEPSPPLPKSKEPFGENSKPPAKLGGAVAPEPRLQLSKGIVIGLGLALVLIGFAGYLYASRTYETLKDFFIESGLDTNYYLFNDLVNEMAAFLALTTAGAIALVLGGIMLKRRRSSRQGPHDHAAGGLIGGGGALALGSLQPFFRYILTSDFFMLELSAGLLLAGLIVIVSGVWAWTRKA